MKDGIRRLYILLDQLLDNPPKNLNMDLWEFCAVGYACKIPELQEEGLIFCRGLPHYREDCGWGAVEIFFEVCEFQSSKLFSPENYKDKGSVTEVAEKLRSYLGIQGTTHGK